MNRRDFLKGLAGLSVAMVLPNKGIAPGDTKILPGERWEAILSKSDYKEYLQAIENRSSNPIILHVNTLTIR